MPSLPSRERGLKYGLDLLLLCLLHGSLPSRERGLKLALLVDLIAQLWSLPSRERGLKYRVEGSRYHVI